jgi:hypothetical protein
VLIITLNGPVWYQRLEEVPRDSCRSFYNIDSKEKAKKKNFHFTPTDNSLIREQQTPYTNTVSTHELE